MIAIIILAAIIGISIGIKISLIPQVIPNPDSLYLVLALCVGILHVLYREKNS